MGKITYVTNIREQVVTDSDSFDESTDEDSEAPASPCEQSDIIDISSDDERIPQVCDKYFLDFFSRFNFKMPFSMLILTSQGHRAFKIKSTEASRIGSNICKVDIYQLLLAVTELISPTFLRPLKKVEMNMINGLYNTERVTLTVLKMRKEGLSGSGPVDIDLLKDVFNSELHFLLHFFLFKVLFRVIWKLLKELLDKPKAKLRSSRLLVTVSDYSRSSTITENESKKQ